MNLVYQQPLEQEKENIDNESIPKEGKYKILIVEDNDSLREMLVNIFKSLYTVITAVNGKEGLEKRVRKCLILLSVTSLCLKCQVQNFCLAIKQNFDTCHIPVVLLTAKTTIEHNLEGLKMGADDYIAKPFNINILLSRCNNLVNNRIMLQGEIQ
ncbi:response regulator [Bacteroides thetaiotaomicron]|nr:response regulator [Bacteroides thetaiotaomicron]